MSGFNKTTTFSSVSVQSFCVMLNLVKKVQLKTDLEEFSSSKMVIIFKIVHYGPIYFVQERLHALVKMSGYSE